MKNFLFITIPTIVILLLILEGFFRFVIPASKFPIRYFDGQEKILRYNNKTDQNGTVTLGKLAEEKYNWTINNYGWNANIDYQEKKAVDRIAIIGDSYIEAFQVSTENHLSRTLDQLMGDNTQVYSFGMSGSPLSHYLHMARYAYKTFKPDVFVISIAHNDFDESLREAVIRDSYMSLQINDSKEILEVLPKEDEQSKFFFLKRSALVSYLFYNLKVRETIRELLQDSNEENTANANIYVDQLDTEKIKLVVDYVLKKFKEEFPSTRIVFMMDAPRGDIYRGDVANSSVLFLESYIKEGCEKYEMEFISLTNYFEEDYRKNNKRFNSEYDYHWNKYAHDLIARHLHQHLMKSQLQLQLN